jgi:hypothetical protein
MVTQHSHTCRYGRYEPRFIFMRAMQLSAIFFLLERDCRKWLYQRLIGLDIPTFRLKLVHVLPQRQNVQGSVSSASRYVCS